MWTKCFICARSLQALTFHIDSLYHIFMVHCPPDERETQRAINVTGAHMSRIVRQPENRLTFSITSTLELKLTLVQWFTCAEPSVRFNIGIDNLADNCMTYGRKMIRNSCSNNWDAIPLTPFVRLKISTAIFCSKRLIFCFVCATKLSVDSWKWSSWH